MRHELCCRQTSSDVRKPLLMQAILMLKIKTLKIRRLKPTNLPDMLGRLFEGKCRCKAEWAKLNAQSWSRPWLKSKKPRPLREAQRNSDVETPRKEEETPERPSEKHNSSERLSDDVDPRPVLLHLMRAHTELPADECVTTPPLHSSILSVHLLKGQLQVEMG